MKIVHVMAAKAQDPKLKQALEKSTVDISKSAATAAQATTLSIQIRSETPIIYFFKEVLSCHS